MAAPELIRVNLGDDTSNAVVSLLREFAVGGDAFDPAPCVHVASTERHSRYVSRRVLRSYPQGTADRVARELLRHLAPEFNFRGVIERDFDFFGALTQTLNELGENRRAGRTLVDELLAGWKRLAQTIRPETRSESDLSPMLQPLGERGRLFGGVVARYRHRLEEANLHDPEDALWLAARHIESAGFQPALVVVEDIERLTPAREALVRALCKSARRAVIFARGIRGEGDELAYTGDGHDLTQALVHDLGGEVVQEREDWPARPLSDICRDWIDDAPVNAGAITLLRPPTRAAEVKEAMREIKRAFHAGMNLSDICVSMPSTSSYRELIEETFGAGGIPFDAPFEVTLDQTPIVAALLGLVRAARNDAARNEVIDALSSPFLPFNAPDDDMREKRLRILDDITRKAWVVGGRDMEKRWIEKLDQSRLPDWLEIREHVVEILALLKPFTQSKLESVEFFSAMRVLIEVSGAMRVAKEDRKRCDPGASLREEALRDFRNLLRDMGAEFERMGNPEMPVGELLRALTEQSATRGVRPPEPAGERVRVLGLGELRGIRFRRLIVLGLTDVDLPRPDDDLMFLPGSREDDLKAQLGARLAKELCAPFDVTAQSDYLFAHMLLAVDESLTLSVPASEGDKSFIPATPFARFLRCAGVDDLDNLPPGTDGEPPGSSMDLAVSAGIGLARLERGADASATLVLDDAWLATGLRGRGIELARTDAGSPPSPFEGVVGKLEPLAKQFAATGKDRHLFSPSQLDSYAECPMRFWSRYIMKAKAPDEPTLDTKPHAIGTLLHAALERWVLLLRREAGQPDVLDDPTKREPVSLLAIGGNKDSARELGLRLMVDAFEHACATNPTEGPFWSGVKRLVGAGLPGIEGTSLGVGLLARFVDNELKRNAAGNAIRFVEFDFGKGNDAAPNRPDSLPGLLEIDLPDGTLPLRGSVDRVDQTPDGLQIIDYKTGATRATSEVRDGKAFQLPSYLAAISQLVGSAPDGMMYLQVKPEGAISDVNVTLYRGNPAYDVGELVFERLPERLSRMLDAMRTGVFMHLPFKGSADPCKYCEYACTCARRMDVIEERQNHLLKDDQDDVPAVYLPDKEPSK